MQEGSRGLRFREIVMLAFVAAACSVLYMQAWVLWDAARAVHPALAEAVYGLWFLASIVAAYIIQKPGVAFAAELAAAAGELLLGSPDALMVLLYGGFQGLGAEAALALFRYRRFHLPALALAGALSAVGSVPLDVMTGYLVGMTPPTLAAVLIVRLLSGAVVAGVGGKLLVDALVPTGVLNAYAVVRSRRQGQTLHEG